MMPKDFNNGYDRIPNDAYMTPKWCVESLLTKWQPRVLQDNAIWEPACGTGNISQVFYEQLGIFPLSTDINSEGYPAIDFLSAPLQFFNVQCVITNPPYTLIKEFITKALNIENIQQVAFLLRHEWDAPKSHRPYLQYPFMYKFILPKRPLWIDGPVKASPRHPYAWYVWDYQMKMEDNPQIVFLD